MKVTSKKKDNDALCYCNSVIRTKYTQSWEHSLHCILCVLLFLAILQYLSNISTLIAFFFLSFIPCCFAKGATVRESIPANLKTTKFVHSRRRGGLRTKKNVLSRSFSLCFHNHMFNFTVSFSLYSDGEQSLM